MNKCFQISVKNIFHFLPIIILFTTSYPLQDSLKSQVIPSEFKTDKVVATVGPITISIDEFYNSYEFGPAFIKRKSESKKNHLKYMIYEKLLALDGYSKNIDKEEEVTSLIKDFKSDLATGEMFKEDILNKIDFSEKEIDTIVTQKQLKLDIRWLYVESK